MQMGLRGGAAAADRARAKFGEARQARPRARRILRANSAISRAVRTALQTSGALDESSGRAWRSARVSHKALAEAGPPGDGMAASKGCRRAVIGGSMGIQADQVSAAGPIVIVAVLDP